MSWLFEDSTGLIVAGVAVELLLAVALVKTGRGTLATVMLGVLILVLAGVAVEKLVVTDRERVEAELDGLAKALESNNLERVLAHIHPSAATVRNKARMKLPEAHIHQARVTGDLEIAVNRLTNPPTARADFIGLINLSTDGTARHPIVRRFRLDFQQEGDRWLVTGHEDHDFRDSRPGP